MSKKIEVAIVGDASNFIRELRTAEGSTNKFGSSLNTLKVAALGAAAGGVAILGKFLEDSVKDAISAQAAHARLETAFHAVGLSAEKSAPQIDAAEAAMRKLGFTDIETENALGSLVAATHDVNKGITDMGTAADLARFKHVSLEQATKMLTMAMTGSQRAIKQLGITVIPVTSAVDALKRSNEDLSTAAGRAALQHAQLVDKLATGQEVISKTSELVKGQGQAFADTAAGGMAQFNANLEHLKVVIGDALLPILTKLLIQVNQFANDLSTVVTPTVNTLRSAYDRLGIAGEALKAVIIYMINPFERIHLAIEGVTAASHALETAYNAVRNAAATVAGFFAGAFHTAVSGAHTVVSGLGAAVNAVKGALDDVRQAAGTVAGYLHGGFEAAVGAVKGVIHAVAAVVNALAGALNAAAGAARALAGALASIKPPNLGSTKGGLLHKLGVPGFASGVSNFAGGLAVVGERGPELVNLPSGSSVSPVTAGGSGGATFVFNFPNYAGDKRELVDMIRREFLLIQKRNGSLGFA